MVHLFPSSTPLRRKKSVDAFLNPFLLACLAGHLQAAPVEKPLSAKSAIPAELQAAIGASLRNLQPVSGGYTASNPNQGFTLGFDARGLRVEAPQASLRLSVTAVGRPGRLRPPLPSTLAVSANRVEYRRGPLTEWYVNDARGLEQGFNLSAAPAGRGPVTLDFSLGGEITPKLQQDGSILLLQHGAPAFRYTGLRAWDSHRRELDARMEVRGSEVRLTVRDTGAVYPITIDPWIEQAVISEPDGHGYDQFGLSIALSGNTALVGAPTQGVNQGAAYIFVKSGAGWVEQAKLIPAHPQSFDYFGEAVALNGDTALVGASGAGVAYIFVRTGNEWTQQAELISSDGPIDSFGSSVALSGTTALIGSQSTQHTGAAYVFVQSGATWTQQARLIASDVVQGDTLGNSVALSGDTAVLGDYGQSTYTGAAYVFVRSGTTWTQQTKLTVPGLTSYDEFANNVAVDGDTALITDSFIQSGNKPGAVYVFVRSGTAWTLQQKLSAPQSPAQSTFGIYLTLSGNIAFIGDTFTGLTYVFLRTGTAWAPNNTIPSAGALAFSNNTLLAGGLTPAGSNVVYAFAGVASSGHLSGNVDSGYPGTSLTLNGSGFAPKETVALLLQNLNGAGFPIANTISASDGSFVLQTQIPLAAYGGGNIQAYGKTSADVATAPLFVQAVIILTPDAGSPGATLSAQGVGFSANEPLSLYWNDPLTALGSVTTDSTGSFSGFSFQIPATSATGKHRVFAQGPTTPSRIVSPVTVQ